jgi:sulfur carrier protein
MPGFMPFVKRNQNIPSVSFASSAVVISYSYNRSMKLHINGEERELADGLTLAALLEQLGMKADRVAVELNREIVRRELWPQTRLHTGDRLEIVQFVGGGL